MSTGWKKTPNAKPTITITIDEDTLKRIEDFQFDNRIPSRSKALAKLLGIALKEIEETEENKSDKE